ncbi:MULTISPECIES: glycoside hydrolase family 3 C-terminal domain-containing protein [unclassified Streptomyces]|uniref:glycoside hydrolase family 3 C-terminal domain-containing protein n=1 Tax=Streptomyces TaxID=1883 RepID=UPI0019051490|nr:MULTISPECIES: glycoside hydrolase family 3 C-terminal domain-containing protein [unclassified Streptomyces]MCU4750121.1 glycoside hydrolase family 3 C-terminal domain-containing protein [Streptomyces sp. G-5]QQN76939.1 glycoside hydrolase family 3 C-terminal domain-containing protein [Streptomyces sp. XC 2026]
MTAHQPAFRNPQLSVAERVTDLLDRLTPAERLAMLHQYAPAVERLAVPAFRTGQEALHGVAWMGPATVFPQAVGLGATWNPELVRRVGEAVGREVRAMRAHDDRVGLNVWSPTVNLLRHPLWGRNEEGYAEDPHLTSAIAVAYTRGLRGEHPVYWRTAPVLKHWLAHNHEADRDTASTSVRARVLHEYELPAFRGPVRAGSVAGVMPAYNLVNGRPNHLSPLLAEHLRTWSEQPLVVCSDAGAPSNIAGSEAYYPSHEEGLAAALRAGVDSFTDHGEDSAPSVERLGAALERGLIGQDDIDEAARRLLDMRFRLGDFDPGLDPFAAEAAFDTPEHRELAREAAEQAVVLLKNDGLLPLRPGLRIAVVGLLADEVKLDWYSGTLLRGVSPLAGLREHPAVGSVTFAEGTDRIRLRTAEGWVSVPAADPEVAVGDRAAAGALDPALIAGRTDLAPLTVTAGSDPEQGSVLDLVDWGEGVLTLRAADGLYVSVAEDGLLRASAAQPGGWVIQEVFTLEPHADGQLLRHRATGRPVAVTPGGLSVAPDAGEGAVFTVETVRRGVDEVARAAADADVVIVVAGNDPHLNGRETEDRPSLALPPQQEALWQAAHAANERTVLVLSSSYPYAVDAADATLPALLWTAHGGQAAGTALARVLLGDVSPAGRLPQTWYGADAELPGPLDYDLIGSRTTYLYYDGTPLYPFGHGLSYTSFGYADASVRQDGETLTAEVTVRNTGTVAGEEVVQVYAVATAPSVPRPHRALVAHRRVALAPGEARRLTFEVPLAEALGFWDVAHGRWTVEPGGYELHIGSSSRDIRERTHLTLDGEPVPPRAVRAAGLAAADFDEADGVEIIDLSRSAGDAVTAAGGAPGRLLFRRCDLGTGGGPAVVTVRVARQEPGEGVLSLRVPGAGGAELTLAVPSTGDRYAYTTVRGELPVPPDGVADLELTVGAGVRVDRLEFG